MIFAARSIALGLILGFMNFFQLLPNFNRVISTLLFFIFCGIAVAQTPKLTVDGTVKEDKARLSGTTIQLISGGNVVQEQTTVSNGKFLFDIPLGAQYMLVFSKAGYVSKKVSFNTESVPEEHKLDFHEFPMEISLFKEIEGLDVSILNKPIAKIYYNLKAGYFDFDEAYTRSIKAELERMEKELLRRQEEEKELQEKYNKLIFSADKSFNSKNYEEAKPLYEQASQLKPKEDYPKNKLKEINAFLGAEQEKEAQYKQLVQEGDKFFGYTDYETAIQKYKAAQEIKPNEASLKTKIAESEKLLAEKQKQKIVDDEYKAAILNADKSFNSKLYSFAKQGYQKALEIKPNEEYPKNRIAEIDKILADKEAENQKEENYKIAIAAADKFFNEKKYQESKVKYLEAGDLKPAEQYPKDRVAEIDKLLTEIAAEKEAKEKAEAEAKAREEKYQNLITEANKAFAAKTYENAKAKYSQALEVKPEEQLPKDKIAEIDKILSDLAAAAAEAKAIEEKYQKLIAEADIAFNNKEFESAKGKYSDALKVKPQEKYPQNQIAAIDKLLADQLAQAEKDEKYNQLIASADASLGNKQYEAAKAKYKEASTVRPNEQYPKDKIAEIEKLLAEIAAEKAAKEKADAEAKALEEKYKQLIQQGDKALNAKTYQAAKDNYTKALELKPSEPYPKDKLAEIDKILAEQKQNQLAAKEKEEKYNKLIALADGEYKQEKYEDAKSNYQQALQVKPGEKYPAKQIEEIDKKLAQLAKQKQLDEQYNSIIVKADEMFQSQSFSEARNAYNNALGVKPNEQYPKDKVKEIDKLLADMAAKEAEEKVLRDQYNKVIGQADFAFKTEDYNTAKTKYSNALTLFPEESYPKEQLKKIEEIQSGASQADAEYNALIKEADNKFGAQEYENARNDYQAALKIKPDENYPKTKLEQIEQAIKDRALKAKQEEEERKKREALEKQKQLALERLNKNKNDNETANINITPPSKEEFVMQLARDYPQGITEEEYKQGNAVITKRIVVKGNRGDEYKKVVHSWGGKFYFKNDTPIAEDIWSKETAPF